MPTLQVFKGPLGYHIAFHHKEATSEPPPNPNNLPEMSNNPADWVVVDITGMTKTTKTDKVLKVLKSVR